MRPGPRTRVLVVDDSPLKRDGVISALEEDPDIEVVGRADGHAAALALALQLEPDVVTVEPAVMCVRGRSTLRRFVASLRGTPVIAVSAEERGDDAVDAVAAGVRGYLGRRTTAADLRDTVKRVHGGASVVDAAIAGRLLRQYAQRARGEDETTETALDAPERDVLRLMRQGHTQDEIAHELGISRRTVQVRTARIRRKTGLRRRSDLLRWAGEHIPA
jgi:NarL family two-component system response regulator LiaR